MFLVGILTKHIFFSVYRRKNLKIVTTTGARIQLRYLSRPKSRGSETYPDLHRETMHVRQQQLWRRRLGWGRADRCSRPGAGSYAGVRSTTTYKPKGPDDWLIPNQTDRLGSIVPAKPAHKVVQSVGKKRPAVSAPDAGGVELQPRPVGAVSGGKRQAGTGLVISYHSRK